MNRYTCKRISDSSQGPPAGQRGRTHSRVDVMKNSPQTRRSAGRVGLSRRMGLAVVWLGAMGWVTTAARAEDATFLNNSSASLFTLTPMVSVSGETSAIVGDPGTNLKSDTDNVLRLDDSTDTLTIHSLTFDSSKNPVTLTLIANTSVLTINGTSPTTFVQIAKSGEFDSAIVGG